VLKGVELVHFIGIGGIGMSGLARVLLKMGYKISGSDTQKNRLTRQLENEGAYIRLGHSPSNLDKADLVVVSSAICPDNPELEEAQRRGIPIVSRGELLAYLTREKDSIVVAGTHGKTTTSSLVWTVLKQAGKDPTVFVGGEISDIKGNSRLGKDKYVVVESDESDGSFLLLSPKIAVLTNLEDDHLDHYKSEEKLLEAFLRFRKRLKNTGILIVNKDDPNLRKILERIPLSSLQRSITYGIESRTDLWAYEANLREFSSSYNVSYKGRCFGQVELSLPGRYNIYNSLAAIAVGIVLKINSEKIKLALSSFQGVRRRFERLGEISPGVLVIDDYAHHPTEIRAVLRTAKRLGRRVIAVFQPHRYTRTKLLIDKFATAFDEADVLILTDIYAAGEDSLPGIDGRWMFERISRGGKEVYYFPHKEQVPGLLSKRAKRGDLILTIGAGDIREVGMKFLNRRDDS